MVTLLHIAGVVGLGIPGAAFAQIATPVPAALAPGETLLAIKATGTVKAVPDVASFDTGVTSDGATPEQAIAVNAETATRLVGAVKAAAIPSSDMRTTAVSLRPRYRQDKEGDDTDEIIGYRATSSLKIEVHNIARAGEVLNVLVKAGATDLSGPSFSFADDGPLIRAARAKAIAAAQIQATDYAAALAMRVGRLLRVNERGMDGGEGNDIIVTAMRRPAPLPIEPGEQTITVTVWVDYALIGR